MQATELVCSAVSYRPATRCRSYRLPVSTTATAVFATAAMRCATSMSTTTTAIATAIAIATATTIAGAAIASAATTVKAMAAPAVSIAPVGPRAHAQEDSIVEIPWPVKSHRRAGVRRIVIVAVRTDGLNANIDDNLRSGRWRQAKAQACEQC